MNPYPALCLTVGNEYKFLYPSEILSLKSDGSYTHLNLKDNQKVILSKKLGDVEAMLPSELFIRVHHSAVINLMHIDKYYNNSHHEIELTDGSKVVLSKR